MKNQYRGGNCLKRGAWTVCRFKGGLARKGGVFEGGWYPNVHYECGFTLKLVHDMITNNQMHHTDKFSQHSVHLWTKWLWVWIPLLSLKLQIWCLLRARSSLTLKQTIECGFMLRFVHDMMITYNQIHHTDKYSQHSTIIWPV